MGDTAAVEEMGLPGIDGVIFNLPDKNLDMGLLLEQ